VLEPGYIYFIDFDTFFLGGLIACKFSKENLFFVDILDLFLAAGSSVGVSIKHGIAPKHVNCSDLSGLCMVHWGPLPKLLRGIAGCFARARSF
jgi:hypothetical protein